MNTLARCQPWLGTYVEVTLAADASDDELISASTKAYEAISKVHHSMGFHDVSSDLSRLNNEAFGHAVVVSDELASLLAYALEVSKASNGIFDVTIAPHLVNMGYLPDHLRRDITPVGDWRDIHLDGNNVRFSRPVWIDLGGVAKGLAVDLAVKSLTDCIPECEISVNAGGDMKMSHWQGQSVGVKVSDDSESVFPLSMMNASIASSSDYYTDGLNAIVSPESGVSAGSNTISIFAESCMVADSLTKVLSLDPEFSLDGFDAKAVILDKWGNILRNDQN